MTSITKLSFGSTLNFLPVVCHRSSKLICLDVLHAGILAMSISSEWRPGCQMNFTNDHLAPSSLVHISSTSL